MKLASFFPTAALTLAVVSCSSNPTDTAPLTRTYESSAAELALAKCETAFDCGCDSRNFETVADCANAHEADLGRFLDELHARQHLLVDEACLGRRMDRKAAEVRETGCADAGEPEDGVWERCVLGTLAPGETCSTSQDCSEGLYCDTSISNTCIAEAERIRGRGDPCAFTSECADGLSCGMVQQIGTASAWICLEPATEFFLGDACAHCAEDFSCYCSHGLLCRHDACVEPGALGDECDPLTCQANLRCDGQTCVEPGSLGDNCAGPTCGARLRCDAEQGKCSDLIDDGERCYELGAGLFGDDCEGYCEYAEDIPRVDGGRCRSSLFLCMTIDNAPALD